MAKIRIYFVENDLRYARFLRQTLSQRGDFEVVILPSGLSCLEVLDKGADLICIDSALTDMSCTELLLRIQAFNRNLSVLVFKVKDDINLSIELLKLGTADYILKSENLPTLQEDYVDVVSDNGDSKIEKELKVIIELAGVLRNENKIYGAGSNCLHHTPANFISPSEKTLREYCVDVIICYLAKYNQNVVKVAEKLDIGKSTIYNMIKSGEITLNK